MKTASTALKNYLAALSPKDAPLQADLYTFTLASGTVLRRTSYDQDLTVAANTWLHSGLILNRGGIKNPLGTEVATLEIDLAADPALLIDSRQVFEYIENGGFDGATLKLESLVMQTPGDTTLGTIHKFEGKISDISEITRAGARLTIKSGMEELNTQLPRNVFSPGCQWTLFDAGCTLVKASFGTNSTVLAGSTAQKILCGLVQAAGYFDQGTITFTSGQNNGQTASVKSYTPGVINLDIALPFIPAVADTFTAFPGCDKLQATCLNKFNNLPNFRGFPFIPKPESAI